MALRSRGRNNLHLVAICPSPINDPLPKYPTYLFFPSSASIMRPFTLELTSRPVNGLSGMQSTIAISFPEITIAFTFHIKFHMIPIQKTPHPSHKHSRSTHKTVTPSPLLTHHCTCTITQTSLKIQYKNQGNPLFDRIWQKISIWSSKKERYFRVFSREVQD